MNFLTFLLDRLTAPFQWLTSLFLGAFTSPRKLLGLSLPVRLAVFSVMFLLLCAITGILLFMTTRDGASWRRYLTPQWMIATGVLLVVIPLLVWKVTKLWLEGDTSLYPDIDRAWEAGLRALGQNGIDLTDVPLFLVTGMTDERETRAVMSASNIPFTVGPVPDGPSPLHWYANDSCLFLCLTDLSLVGQTTGNAGKAPPAALPGAGGEPKYGGVFRETMMLPGQGGGASSTSSIHAPEDFGAPVAPAPAAAAFTGTMQFGDSSLNLGPAIKQAMAAAPAPIRKLSEGAAREVRERTAYLCNLLKNAREPYCPANGVVSLLPFPFIAAASANAGELQKCVADDMTALRDGLDLRCPVTCLIGGMESESGFRELARRLGRDAVKTSRFGKGSDLWTQPEPEMIEAVVRHACGAIEDWTYHLFSADDGLSKTGNTKLYALLCRIRTEVQDRLAKILSDGYGRDADTDAEPLLFSGVYFGATGSEDDRQAFVKSVFEKVLEQQEELSWTGRALRRDAGYAVWRGLASVVNMLLLAAIAVIVFLWVTNRPVPEILKPWVQKIVAAPSFSGGRHG